MEQAEKRFYTIQDYNRLEEENQLRYEYHDGEVFAMAGGDPKHSAIAANFLILLGNQLNRVGCRPYISDLKIHIESVNRSIYPGVSVFCGERFRSEQDNKAYNNPVLIAEVSSPTTVNYDTQEKFWFYSQLASLKEYVLISQDRVAVQLFYRESHKEKWQMEWIVGNEAIVKLQSLKAEIPLEDIYFDVE
jgi:Uma2 family endonuclease